MHSHNWLTVRLRACQEEFHAHIFRGYDPTVSTQDRDAALAQAERWAREIQWTEAEIARSRGAP